MTCSTATKRLILLGSLALFSWLLFVLCACSQETLAVNSENDGTKININAENSTGTAVSNLVVPENGITQIDCEISTGDLHIRIVGENEQVFYDATLSGTQMIKLSDPAGECTVKIDSREATGTATIFAFVESETSDQIANPWKQADNAQQAGEKAGLGSFSVPENVTVRDQNMRHASAGYMDGTAEVVLRSEGGSICIRKSTLPESEISGDYNAYEYEWTWNIDGKDISCKGYSEEKAANMTWTDDKYSYSVVMYSLNGPAELDKTSAEMLVSQIH